MPKGIPFILSAATIIFLAFLALPLFGRSIFEEAGIFSAGNRVLAGELFHAWMSLAAGIIVLGLAMKHMRGGMLAKPVIVIGAGILANAFLGFLPVLYRFLNGGAMLPSSELQVVWLGNFILSISVIIAVFWIAKLFGVFALPEK